MKLLHLKISQPITEQPKYILGFPNTEDPGALLTRVPGAQLDGSQKPPVLLFGRKSSTNSVSSWKLSPTRRQPQIVANHLQC